MSHHYSKWVKKGAKGFCYALLFILSFPLIAQDNCYTIINEEVINDKEHKYRIYNMVIDTCNGKKVKSAYVVRDAYKKFKTLQSENDIILVAAASYSSSIFDSIGKPVGFCSEKGAILNKMPNDTMDGLVILNTKDVSDQVIEVVDLDENLKQCDDIACETHPTHLNIRENPSDTYGFMSLVKDQSLSCFQTHLLYSHNKTYEENFRSLNNGTSDRCRRFLILCQKNNVKHHIVVDHISGDYLMQAAKRCFDYIKGQGYEIRYILNLDTGNKDIFHAFNGSHLENLRPNPTVNTAVLEKAVSLVIYYTEKQKYSMQ